MTPAEHEARRILAENRRRESQTDDSLYSAAHPAEFQARQERARVAVRDLVRAGAFPRPGDPVLEIGYGRLGWLAELLGWGLRAADVHGLELDPKRAAIAAEALPGADLRVGDGSALPWPDASFRLVILSTVLTSILDSQVRRDIAGEAARVTAPAGSILWYDFRWNNPRNPHVRGIDEKELRHLFPGFGISVRRLTLAPPIARSVAPRSWWLAETLGRLPPLRSHLLAILRRPPEAETR